MMKLDLFLFSFLLYLRIKGNSLWEGVCGLYNPSPIAASFEIGLKGDTSEMDPMCFAFIRALRQI